MARVLSGGAAAPLSGPDLGSTPAGDVRTRGIGQRTRGVFTLECPIEFCGHFNGGGRGRLRASGDGRGGALARRRGRAAGGDATPPRVSVRRLRAPPLKVARLQRGDDGNGTGAQRGRREAASLIQASARHLGPSLSAGKVRGPAEEGADLSPAGITPWGGERMKWQSLPRGDLDTASDVSHKSERGAVRKLLFGTRDCRGFVSRFP